MKRQDSGATLIETVLILPTFLGIILITIWVATILNAKSSLSTALGHSLRLAVTRANPSALGRELFDLNSNPSALSEVLCHGIEESRCLPTYDKCYVQQLFLDGTSLNSIPDKYKYLALYINESVRLSLGNLVKFPCSPNNSDDWCPGYTSLAVVDTSMSSSGCMICRLINAMNSPPAPPALSDRIDAFAPADDVDDPTNLASLYGSIGVECAYEIDSSLIRPVQGLLRWVGVGGIVISATQVLKSDNLAPPNSIL